MQNPTTFIYIIGETGTNFVKIGISNNPHGRINGLQTANPRKLALLGAWPGTEQDETEHHRILADFRREGEWFELPECILQGLRRKSNYDLRPKTESVKVESCLAEFLRNVPPPCIEDLTGIAEMHLTQLAQKPNNSKAAGRREWLRRNAPVLREGTDESRAVAAEIDRVLAVYYVQPAT